MYCFLINCDSPICGCFNLSIYWSVNPLEWCTHVCVCFQWLMAVKMSGASRPMFMSNNIFVSRYFLTYCYSKVIYIFLQNTGKLTTLNEFLQFINQHLGLSIKYLLKSTKIWIFANKKIFRSRQQGWDIHASPWASWLFLMYAALSLCVLVWRVCMHLVLIWNTKDDF